MKTYLTKLLILLGLVGLWGGCSLEDQDGLGDYELDELVLDDFADDEWDGVGLPSWLGKRYLSDFFSDLGWGLSSWLSTTLINVYSFDYKDNTLLVLSCDFFANKHTESCTMCYTGDGRRIDFEKIKGYFEKNSTLIYSNALDGDNTPKVSDFNLEPNDNLEWLQSEINGICLSIHEPEQVLAYITCGYVNIEQQLRLVLEFEYYDSKNMENGPITVRRIFQPNGQIVSESLIVDNNKNIIDYINYSTVWTSEYDILRL